VILKILLLLGVETRLSAVEKVKLFDPIFVVKVVPFGINKDEILVEGVIVKLISASADLKDLGI
jgi:hypothetical protein